MFYQVFFGGLFSKTASNPNRLKNKVAAIHRKSRMILNVSRCIVDMLTCPSKIFYTYIDKVRLVVTHALFDGQLN